MLLLSISEFRANISKYLAMAAQEKIAIKCKSGIFNITPSTEIRTNNPSPSNDPWFDVPENMAHLNKAIEESKNIDISQLKSYSSISELKKDLGL